MATMTVSLPDPMKEWVEDLVSKGDFASSSDYIRAVIRRDRELREPNYQMTIEDLRQLLDDSEASGISTRTVTDILEAAKQAVAARHTNFG